MPAQSVVTPSCEPSARTEENDDQLGDSPPFGLGNLAELLSLAFAQGGTFLDLLLTLTQASLREVPGYAFRRLLDSYELTEAVRDALQDPTVLESLDAVWVDQRSDPPLVEFRFAESQTVPRTTPVGIVRVQLERTVGFFVSQTGAAELRAGDIRLQWFVISEGLGLQIRRIILAPGAHDDILQITAGAILASSSSLRRFYLPQRAPVARPAPPPGVAPLSQMADLPWPDSATVMTVEHHLPGRVRLHVSGLYRSEELKRRLERQLRVQVGIKTASANALTGCVLVTYDETAVPLGKLQDWVNQVIHGRELNVVEQLGRPHDPWHVMTADAVLRLWESCGETGLDEATVSARRSSLGPNVVTQAQPRSKLEMFIDQFRSLPVALLGASALLSLATGGIADAIVIASVVLANAAIGYGTEQWAERTIADLVKGGEIIASVVRNGQPIDLPAHDLVPGDVITLKRGAMIPADARLLATDGLSVDESPLSGESVPVPKSESAQPHRMDPLSARRNLVYRGTVVTGGTGRAVVVGTGPFTEMGKVQRLISEARQPETPLQRQLAMLGSQLVMTTLAVCGGVFAMGLLRGRGLLRMLQTSVSLAVAAVPEGLPTVATTTLALGMRRLQQQEVLVRRLNAVETLGAVQDLCLDKTGTITWSRMSVVACYSGMLAFRRQDGGFLKDELPVLLDKVPELGELLRISALCSEVEIDLADTIGTSLTGTPTEKALMQAALDAGIDVQALRCQYSLVRTRHRSDRRVFMDMLHVDADGQMLLAVKGRPSQVLAMCRHHLVDGERQTLTEEARARILLENERMAGRALRVLGIAFGDTEALPEDDGGLTWLGLVGIADPPRAGMADLMARFHRAGIHTAMITGDQSATAYAVAREIGLSRDGNLEILDATQLEELEPDVLRTLAQRVDIFSRVSPAHKLQIVQALQKTGHVVAMTGDGINDGPALRAADVGIAMGQSGSRVAQDVAEIVVANDNLATLITAIEQGRTIYDDIKKAVHFILSSNTSEIMLTTGAILAGLGEPLTPMQLLWINLVTDIFPELALGVDPPEVDVMRRLPRDPRAPMFAHSDLERILLEGALLTTGAMTAYGWGIARYGLGPRASALAFTSLTTAQLLHAISCRSECNSIFSGQPFPKNPFVPLTIVGGLALQGLAMAIPGLRSLLGAAPLGLADWAVSITAGLAPLFVNETLKMTRRPGTTVLATNNDHQE